MMNKRLLNNFLYGALLFSLGTSVFSCKDYDADIEGLNNRITTVESDMERFKQKIEAALNANLTVTDWYLSDDQSQYTVVLSNGDELHVQASNKTTPFFQFKTEDGIWKYSSDKGAGWHNLLVEGTEATIPGAEKDNLYYDKTTGSIYINKTEGGMIKTTIVVPNDAPIMALNTENKTLSIYIYGENYILPVQGGGYSGISSILFRKQFAFDPDEYLEAASFSNKAGVVIAANKAIAQFKILPKDIDLSAATFACTDIHELKLTRAEVPQLLVEVVDNAKLDKDGILTVELTPQNMTAEYYGAVLEITLDKTTTSSNYFTVKPTSYSAGKGIWAYRSSREVYEGSQALQFISSESLDLSQMIGWGFGKSGEVKFVDELGFNGLAVTATYKLTDNPGNVFTITDKGVVTATKSNQNGKVSVTYLVGKEGAAKEDLDEITQEFSIYSQDEATAKNGIGLTAKDAVLSNIETLYKTTRAIEVYNSQTTMEQMGILTSQAWKLGIQENNVWKTYEFTTPLASITEASELGKGEICLCYNATTKKSYLLVGPQVNNVTGNLFAMKTDGSSKELFTKDGKEVGIYINNLITKYVVEEPKKKDDLMVMIYGKGGMNNPAAVQPTRLGMRHAIPGTYDDVKGYHFTDIDLTTLYDFKPADADFVIGLDQANQNDKTKAKWSENKFIWKNGKLTILPFNLYEINLVDKKIVEADEKKNGVWISWTFNAGQGEKQSNGLEQWYIKDPVRQPGDNIIYMGDEKPDQLNAIGEMNKDYNLKFVEITGDDSKNKPTDLTLGATYVLGNYFKLHSFWRKGCGWDTMGGPAKKTGKDLPPLLIYDEIQNKIVMTEHCKKYFCKSTGSLTLFAQGADNAASYDINNDNQSITIKAIKTSGNDYQFKFQFVTDYGMQELYFRITDQPR